MLRPTILVLATLAVTLILTGSLAAQDGRRGSDRTSGSASQQVQGFSTSERQTITDYFSRNTYTPEALPPGIVKKLARGKPLPPGIAKRSLPPDLTAALPVRDGLEVTIFGDRIVLLEASGLIVDILEGIF
jgi:hypothetical protein